MTISRRIFWRTVPAPLPNPSAESIREWPCWALGSQALLRDTRGRVALFKPAYRNRDGGLLLSGGAVEEGEDPYGALGREVSEETGLQRAPIRLLVTEWADADPKRKKPAGINLVYDVDVLAPGEWESVRLAPELSGKFLVRPEALKLHVAPLTERRIRAALQALDAGHVELPPLRYAPLSPRTRKK
ncbi:NUDIX domain-containing protein [Streptomyces sp. CNQ-509]|uniref:NUDIX domain-containing protein n=1 Tax=Streptomyces sp. CNQ-509 TaxID=444103 RepID=UPI0026574A01|nr:NUDIX domain-containing protein [Streptomyces sp. CNQ-509]